MADSSIELKTSASSSPRINGESLVQTFQEVIKSLEQEQLELHQLQAKRLKFRHDLDMLQKQVNKERLKLREEFEAGLLPAAAEKFLPTIEKTDAPEHATTSPKGVDLKEEPKIPPNIPPKSKKLVANVQKWTKFVKINEVQRSKKNITVYKPHTTNDDKRLEEEAKKSSMELIKQLDRKTSELPSTSGATFIKTPMQIWALTTPKSSMMATGLRCTISLMDKMEKNYSVSNISTVGISSYDGIKPISTGESLSKAIDTNSKQSQSKTKPAIAVAALWTVVSDETQKSAQKNLTPIISKNFEKIEPDVVGILAESIKAKLLEDASRTTANSDTFTTSADIKSSQNFVNKLPRDQHSLSTTVTTQQTAGVELSQSYTISETTSSETVATNYDALTASTAPTNQYTASQSYIATSSKTSHSSKSSQRSRHSEQRKRQHSLTRSMQSTSQLSEKSEQASSGYTESYTPSETSSRQVVETSSETKSVKDATSEADTYSNHSKSSYSQSTALASNENLSSVYTTQDSERRSEIILASQKYMNAKQNNVIDTSNNQYKTTMKGPQDHSATTLSTDYTEKTELSKSEKLSTTSSLNNYDSMQKNASTSISEHSSVTRGFGGALAQSNLYKSRSYLASYYSQEEFVRSSAEVLTIDQLLYEYIAKLPDCSK